VTFFRPEVVFRKRFRFSVEILENDSGWLWYQWVAFSFAKYFCLGSSLKQLKYFRRLYFLFPSGIKFIIRPVSFFEFSKLIIILTIFGKVFKFKKSNRKWLWTYFRSAFDSLNLEHYKPAVWIRNKFNNVKFEKSCDPQRDITITAWEQFNRDYCYLHITSICRVDMRKQ